MLSTNVARYHASSVATWDDLHGNRPFPVTSKYVQNPWHRVWGTSKRSLRQILHCYIRQRGWRLDGCYFGYRRNPELSRHWSRVPAATFSAVLVSKSVRLRSTLLWSYKIMHLVCIQRCVVTAKCLLTSSVPAKYNLQQCAPTQSVCRPVLVYVA